MDENISPIENPIFVILTKNTSLQHYVQIAMIQRVFEHALFTVLYTPTACPTDSNRLSSDPAISNGLSGQSIRS